MKKNRPVYLNYKQPPLEVSFYCDAPTTEKDAFLHFLKALIGLGAKPVMQIDLDDLFDDPSSDPSSIEMTHLLGLVPKGSPETVALNYISEKAVELGDHRCFTIFADIDLLNKKTIPPLTARFLEIVDVVRPQYACFCFIDYLECPADLENGSREFHDFYISRKAVGRDYYRRLLEGSEGAYRQEFEHGLYLSTTTMNPLHMSRYNPFLLRQVVPGIGDLGQMIHRRWMNKKLYPET